MRFKTLIITIFVLLSCATCFGQSSYKGLTPGKSTRADVDKALGQPTSQVTERLLEYNNGGKQIYVQYSKESPTAIRIEVIYSPPLNRSEILSPGGLPKVPDTRRTNKKGALEEYFGQPQYIVLTYEESSQSLVSQVGYYSPGLFESVTPELPKTSSPPAATLATPAPASRASDIPSLNANVVSLRFYEAGGENPPFGQREYKNRFSKSDTRGVFVELQLQFPDPGRRIDFSIDFVFHRDGAFHYQTKYPTAIEAGWPTSHHAQGVGWLQAGNWLVGSYLVELFIDGRKIAAGSFDVY